MCFKHYRVSDPTMQSTTMKYNTIANTEIEQTPVCYNWLQKVVMLHWDPMAVEWRCA